MTLIVKAVKSLVRIRLITILRRIALPLTLVVARITGKMLYANTGLRKQSHVNGVRQMEHCRVELQIQLKKRQAFYCCQDGREYISWLEPFRPVDYIADFFKIFIR